MKNDYRYIDNDYTYSDPETGVLRNLAGITDHESLVFAESAAVTKRANELKSTPIVVENSDSLFEIHHYLFQDIYAWAGKRRTVEISKEGKQFFPLSHFDNALVFIDKLLVEYKGISDSDKKKISQKLSEILDAVNYLHPFREGNGRTQREFLRSLAYAKGWSLNLNPPDNTDVYERYMTGTINGDTKLLGELIFKCMNKL